MKRSSEVWLKDRFQILKLKQHPPSARKSHRHCVTFSKPKTSNPSYSCVFRITSWNTWLELYGILNVFEIDHKFLHPKHVHALNTICIHCASLMRIRVNICCSSIDDDITAAALPAYHYNDVIVGAMASQITNLNIVYSTVSSGADQGKHQSSA